MLLLTVEHYCRSPFHLSRGAYINWGSTTYEWAPAHVTSRRQSHPLVLRKAGV